MKGRVRIGGSKPFSTAKLVQNVCAVNQARHMTPAKSD